MEHLTDLLGFQVFPVDELRAAGLGFAAQACDGDCGIGLPDEAEHAVDRIAPGRDAADKALEEDHLDIEGDFGQFDEKPCDGGQLVCRVALRPDHAAAAFDLGDLPDLSGGLLRAGHLFDSQFPGCAQCQRKLFYGRAIKRDVEFVAVMDIEVHGEDSHEQQQRQRVERSGEQRRHGEQGERVYPGEITDFGRRVENQALQPVGILVGEPGEGLGTTGRKFPVSGETVRAAAESRGILLSPERAHAGIKALLPDFRGRAVDALEYGVEVEVGRGFGVDRVAGVLRRAVVEIAADQVEVARRALSGGRRRRPEKG